MSGDGTHSVRVELTTDDLRQFGVYSNLKRFGRFRLNLICHIPLFLGLAGVLLLLLFRDDLFRHEWVPLVLVAIVTVMTMASAVVSNYLNSTAIEGQTYFRRPADLSLDADGLKWRNDVAEGKIVWGGVTEVAESDRYIFLFLDRAMAHLIPKRSFESPEAAQRYLDTARRYWQRARGGI